MADVGVEIRDNRPEFNSVGTSRSTVSVDG